MWPEPSWGFNSWNSIIVSPNSDRAAFPRREPLAAVEPLGVSPLSSCHWRTALGADNSAPPSTWVRRSHAVQGLTATGSPRGILIDVNLDVLAIGRILFEINVILR